MIHFVSVFIDTLVIFGPATELIIVAYFFEKKHQKSSTMKNSVLSFQHCIKRQIISFKDSREIYTAIVIQQN